MTLLCYSSVRITLRGSTGEWTYVSGSWRQHMAMTKERLLREIADWIKRAQHEAKLAFAEGDLWSALAWGAKVPEFVIVAESARAHAYETGATIDVLCERVGRIVREIDPYCRIRRMFERPHDIVVGIDLGIKGGSATAIATLFRKELDRMGRESKRIVDSFYVDTAGPASLDVIAREPGLPDDELRKRVRDDLRERMSGKSPDLLIIDDPYKE